MSIGSRRKRKIDEKKQFGKDKCNLYTGSSWPAAHLPLLLPARGKERRISYYFFFFASSKETPVFCELKRFFYSSLELTIFLVMPLTCSYFSWKIFVHSSCNKSASWRWCISSKSSVSYGGGAYQKINTRCNMEQELAQRLLQFQRCNQLTCMHGLEKNVGLGFVLNSQFQNCYTN